MGEQTARNKMVKKYATMASVFALGVVLGMICLSTMESEGLNGSSVLKTIAPSKSHSKARYSAGCYGDSSLCGFAHSSRARFAQCCTPDVSGSLLLNHDRQY